MTLTGFIDDDNQLTRSQRWSHYLTLFLFVLTFIYGVNIRNNILGATIAYTNVLSGISLQYPANWLLDEDGENYIFRVRDMTRVGFKTTIQISTLPVGSVVSPQNLLNSLALQRSTQLAQYNTLSITQADDLIEGASGMTYYFTTSSVDTSLEILPTVVIGYDILTVVRGQAIVVTFLADAESFPNQISVFERFLTTLEFQ